MGRVLRIGAGLMGVLLVVMTAGLCVQRSPEAPPSIIISQRKKDSCSSCTGSNERWISRLLVGQEHPRRLTPSLDEQTRVTISPDSEWFYFTESETHTISRMRSDGSQMNRLVENGSILEFFQMDGEWWLLYQKWVSPDSVQAYISRLDGSSQSVLAGGFEGKIMGGRLKVSPKNKLFIFAGELNGVSDIYRVSFMGGPIENLTTEVDDPIDVITDFPGSEWVLVNAPPSFFLLNFQNGQIRPLLENVTFDQFLYSWIEHSELLIAFGYDPVANGIYLGQPQPVWTIENVYFDVYPTLDGEWLIFEVNDSIERMHPDGTERSVLYGRGGQHITVWEVTPDGRWVLFIEKQTDRSFLKRLRITDSKVETLYELGSDSYEFRTWSPDQKWGIFSSWNNQNKENSIRRIFLMRSDGSDIQFLTQSPFLAWGGDVTHAWQPVLLLLIGSGLIGISIFGKRPYHLIRQRLRPAA